MVILVLRTDALEDENGVVHRRSFHLHGLKTAVEGRVLLDVFPIFVERGRADALQLTARKRGLENIGGVHGPLGGTGADDGVELVNEEDDVLRALDLVHDGLDALFKLAAVFGAGDHQGEVEGDDLFLGENFRDVTAHNFLRESLDQRGLADARFADEDGIVLRATAKNLDNAPDLVLTSDDRVQLTLARKFGQITTERLQRRCLHFLFVLGLASRALRTSGDGFFSGTFGPLATRKLGIELAEDFVASALDVDVEGF